MLQGGRRRDAEHVAASGLRERWAYAPLLGLGTGLEASIELIDRVFAINVAYSASC